ncbi:hypothetical protein [Undibacterium parvum]|uniref:Uncharacterized protein n=1 Tax=Undibacterium parvum TaxID=401471 RepID=A0A3S9HJC5_9BURK|nr:hypothetical protein [Undibacterium parvum]AZP12182.1 hypothetical protein EJN92_09295 [Undibacterium parvum]
MTDSFVSPVLFAVFGAFATKFLELAELHKLPKSQRPDLKDWLYWFSFFIMPVLGGGLAFMYVSSDIVLKPVLAVNIGISAPLILRAMAVNNPFQPKEIITEPDA